MQSIFGMLYAALFFSYIAAAVFIVFHIIRYSLKRSTSLFGLTLFLVVLIVLLFSNVLIFFSLPVDELLPRAF